MALKIPVFRKLRVKAETADKEWLIDLYSNLNLFGEQVAGLFKSGANIGMIQGQKFSTTITTDAAGAFTPITFSYTGSGIPDCFVIGNISRPDGGAISATSITAASLNSNTNPATVLISGIAGLSPSVIYNLTVAVF